ncbi:SPOR domain-containing protein [Alloalcanivorax sp. C16-2]|uniref:SPOR domain-containing protein n=1 Tax=Alloalcanivorax sp. C16-2 TaxID=3390052 RepID=UPI003970A799
MRDEDFFYEGAERGDLLDALNGHAHEGATVVLEGEPGSGVSTLLGMLAMSLVGDYELIRLDGDDNLGANAVVDAMLVHFGIERDDLAETLKQSLARNRLVILVDNADRVPEAALATMASLKEKLGQRLTYVFGGAPGTARSVGEGGLTVVDTLVLPPLDAEDVATLAEQFHDLSLDEGEAEYLRAETGGRLGPLLALLDERAEEAAPPARKPVPWRHGLAVGALILVVLVLWLASGDDEPGADQVVSLDLPQRPAQTVDPEGGDAAGDGLTPETAEDGHDYGLVSDPEQTRNALAEFHDNAADFEQAETRRQERAGAAEANTGETAPAPPAEPEGQNQTAEPAPRARPEPRPADRPAGDEAPASADAGREPSSADDSSADDDAPGQGTVSASQPELSGLEARLGYRQEDWLATRDDGEWFLQLVATGREDGARGVLDRIGRQGAYYQTERGDNKVYLVLAGPYPSRDAALAARETLPETLRRGGPFPREMGSIRKELR